MRVGPPGAAVEHWSPGPDPPVRRQSALPAELYHLLSLNVFIRAIDFKRFASGFIKVWK